MRMPIPCCGAALLALALAPAIAQQDFAAWPPLRPSFPSTGGNGIVIGEYSPVVTGDRCATDFTATGPDGVVHRNSVEFDAVPAQGGILCTNGRWRSADGSATGTTPFQVFVKDGMVRGSP